MSQSTLLFVVWLRSSFVRPSVRPFSLLLLSLFVVRCSLFVGMVGRSVGRAVSRPSSFVVVMVALVDRG